MASHRMRGRQLSRDTEHRGSLRRSLVQSLFEHGKIRTTLPKALEVKGFAEKMITLARVGTLNARRRVISLLHDRRLVDENFDLIEEGPTRTIVQKLFNDIAPKFADRPGGYTRIIKLAEHRIGDGGGLVLLQLLTEESKPTGTARRSLGLRRKRNERKHQFAARVLRKGGKAGQGTGGPESSGGGESAAPVQESTSGDAPTETRGDSAGSAATTS